MESNPKRGLILKIGITWLCILLLGGFFIASRSNLQPVTLSIIPEIPKASEPVVATFYIKNPGISPSTNSYQLFVNGRQVESGSTIVGPGDSTKYQYAYTNALERGEQINFVLKSSSANGDFDKIVSLPAYPSQLMSSFVSFAAFSTSVMSSMISVEYFSTTFGTASGLNTGIIISAVLIALLVFLELTQKVTTGRGINILGRYRFGLGNMATILFIIFIGMVYTTAIMILST